jgi:hypothetical protein
MVSLPTLPRSKGRWGSMSMGGEGMPSHPREPTPGRRSSSAHTLPLPSRDGESAPEGSGHRRRETRGLAESMTTDG